MLDKVNNPTRRLIAAATLGVLVLPVAVVSAAAYRWIDKDGSVVYSQTRPPPGQEAAVVKPPPPPADPQAAERLREQMLRLEDNREDRELDKQKTAEEQSNIAAREHNCRALTDNMEGIRNLPPNRLVRNPDGSYHRQTEADKQARLAELQQRYDEECN